MEDYNWKAASEQDQMQHVRQASVAQLSVIMREYNWSLYPESVLGWISAQKGIGLSAAMSAFFNGDPWRFNYLPKRDVSNEYSGVVRLLDTINRRINAGFYLPDPVPLCTSDMHKLDAWLDHQREDLRDHRRGRWVIEPEVLDPLFASKRAAVEEQLRREPMVQISGAEDEDQKSFSLKKLVRPLAS